MTQWKSLIGNSNLIQAETATSYLIKLPHQKLKFWHPKKLVRLSGKGGYRMDIRYTDDFSFKCFRNGEGQYNRRDVIEERTLTASEMEAAFGVEKTEDEAAES